MVQTRRWIWNDAKLVQFFYYFLFVELQFWNLDSLGFKMERQNIFFECWDPSFGRYQTKVLLVYTEIFVT